MKGGGKNFMQEVFVYALLIIAIGTLTLYTSLKFIKNPDYAKHYIKNNPKAFVFRKLFGEEKALRITRNFFAPFGAVISLFLFLFGIYLLSRLIY